MCLIIPFLVFCPFWSLEVILADLLCFGLQRDKLVEFVVAGPKPLMLVLISYLVWLGTTGRVQYKHIVEMSYMYLKRKVCLCSCDY
jgi:hypothetical protein